jgi:hypothetical protein
MQPLSEDFARWRDDPMTRMVLASLELAEKAQRADWLTASWDGGVARGEDLERKLLVTRTRADAYRALIDMTFEDVAAWLELKPDAE